MPSLSPPSGSRSGLVTAPKALSPRLAAARAAVEPRRLVWRKRRRSILLGFIGYEFGRANIAPADSMRQYTIKLIAGRQGDADGSVHRRRRWIKDQERTPVGLAQIAAGLDHVAVKRLDVEGETKLAVGRRKRCDHRRRKGRRVTDCENGLGAGILARAELEGAARGIFRPGGEYPSEISRWIADPRLCVSD